MPRTTLSAVASSQSGTAKPYVAADAVNGMEFANTGKEYLEVKNGSGASINVTVASIPCSHGRTGDQVVAVAAGAEKIIGPFQTHLFNQPNGMVNVDFSAGTTVTVAAVRG